jgi:hypothetical protein
MNSGWFVRSFARIAGLPIGNRSRIFLDHLLYKGVPLVTGWAFTQPFG